MSYYSLFILMLSQVRILDSDHNFVKTLKSRDAVVELHINIEQKSVCLSVTQ